MVIVYILAILLILFVIAYIISMEVEKEKRKRNPIPKKDNSENRFTEIKIIYSHDMFKITRGN